MPYFDVMLESEDSVLINKVLENATYQMCIEGGDVVINDVEDYINLLEDKDHEPTAEFDEFMFETLSPYLENNSKYLGMFLFEYISSDEKIDRAKRLQSTRSPEKQAKRDKLDQKFPNKDSIYKRQNAVHGKENADKIRQHTLDTNRYKSGSSPYTADQQKQMDRERKSLARSQQENPKILAQQKEQRDKEAKERSSGTNKVAEMQKNNDAKIKNSKSDSEKTSQIEAAKAKGKSAFDGNKAKSKNDRNADNAADRFSKGGSQQSDKQAAKNKVRRDALLTGKSKLTTIDSMKKGLQKAKMKLGGKVMTSAKKFANKAGKDSMLGKVANVVGSVGRKVAQSGGTGRRNLNNKLTRK